MSEAGWRALEEQLGGAPPTELRALSDEHLRDLAGSIRQARRQQAAQLAAAGDKALDLVPRMLRGPVRRMLER